MDEVVIASRLVREPSRCAPEFALCNNEGFIQLCTAIGARSNSEVGYQICETSIELAGRTVNSIVCLIDVLMVVPTAQCDHDESRTEVGCDEITRHDTGISESVVSVPL